METTEKIVEKKVYEEGSKHQYASRGTGNAGLTLGIIGTALGGIAAAGLWGRGGKPGGVTSGEVAEVTSFASYNKECEDVLKLTNEMWGMKASTMQSMYESRQTDNAEKFSLWKGQIDADFSLYKGYRDMGDSIMGQMNAAAFGLYKQQRDGFDALAGRIANLEKDVAVNTAIRPYQDRLLQCEIDKRFVESINYTNQKTCKAIYGEVVLPSTPVVTGYGSYSACASATSAS